MYEQLSSLQLLHGKDGLDDVSKYFYISNHDYSAMANMMSEALGISISLVADVHHLTSRGITPLFPDLMNRYFQNTFKYLSKPDRESLMNSINAMMKTAYTELLLGDTIVDTEYKTFEDAVSNELNYSENRIGLKERLKSSPKRICEKESSSNDREECHDQDESNSIDILSIINEKAKIYNISEKSLRDTVKLISVHESEFYHYLSDLCESQGMTIEDILGNE